MEEKISQLKDRIGEIVDILHAASVLSWDMQTYMPPGGSAGRGQQLSTLRRLAHEKATSPEIGKLLDELTPYSEQIDPDSDDFRFIKVVRREHEKRTRVPTTWVSEFSRLTSDAHHIWEQARAETDFTRFQPYLEKIVEMRRQYATFFAPYDHVYDPQLDDFEPGMKTVEVQSIFNTLRSDQVALIQAIKEQPQIDDSFLQSSYDEQKHWDFGVEVISRFGYDWKRGRQDKTVHPFTTSFGAGDVRITTRFDPEFSMGMLFSTLHEAGHALYGQGIHPSLQRTPLENGASMAVHESQSRMWENLVGRSREFWTYFYPRLQTYFPGQLNNIKLESFYKAINKVEPSLIRVEADEATYNLHIMLRMELEIALLEGSLEVAQLPEAWNSRMQEYLGLTPPNVALGVLQDVHWSSGYFGYFPTYALGNLVSVQLWERIREDIPDLPDQISTGEFSALLSWLQENILRHGRKFDPQELVERVTGSKITPEPYLRYLRTKYSEIYQL